MNSEIYVASKTKHFAMWQKLRDDGLNIVSTWIDEAGPGETKSYAELATRCLNEIKRSDLVILYCEPDEILKGAILEVGAALAYGKPVHCFGTCQSISQVFASHPLWKTHDAEPIKLFLSKLKLDYINRCIKS